MLKREVIISPILKINIIHLLGSRSSVGNESSRAQNVFYFFYTLKKVNTVACIYTREFNYKKTLNAKASQSAKNNEFHPDHSFQIFFPLSNDLDQHTLFFNP